MTRWTFPALLLAAGGCSLFSSKPPQFAPVRGKPPLAGTVRAHLSVVNPGRVATESGALILELKLVNVSRKDAIVYNELTPGWLVVIEVLAEGGRRVFSPPLEKIRRGQGGRDHYVRLPPGGFVGRRYQIRPAGLAWQLSPGRYRVRALYGNLYEACPVRPGLTDDDIRRLKKDAAVPLLTGVIVSNVETFRVAAD